MIDSLVIKVPGRDHFLMCVCVWGGGGGVRKKLKCSQRLCSQVTMWNGRGGRGDRGRS